MAGEGLGQGCAAGGGDGRKIKHQGARGGPGHHPLGPQQHLSHRFVIPQAKTDQRG
jgi:hypothetical protein